MEQGNNINFDDVAQKLMEELKLRDDAKGRGPSEALEGKTASNETESLGASGLRIFPSSKISFEDERKEKNVHAGFSDAARYVLENYKPIDGHYGYEDYSREETETIDAIVRCLPKDELEQIKKLLPSTCPIYWRLQGYIKGRYDHFVKPYAYRQLSINTLIKYYKESKKGRKGEARQQLQTRFNYQSFTDQMKIIRLFLKGVRTDREWCYKKLWHWWDDALIPDLEQAWLDFGDKKCVQTAAMRLPEDFIREHQEAMGKLDYKSVCNRLAHDESFVIDRKRLSALDYCYVIAHTRRHLSDEEADQLLFGQIKRVLGSEYNTPMEFRTRFDPVIKDRIEDKVKYVPSLTFVRSISYMVWTLGQTGNASTLVKFHRWNKMLQANMPQYLAEEKQQEDMVDFINEDFGEYQQWNWSIFVKHAKLTLDDVVTLVEEELEELEEPMVFWSRLLGNGAPIYEKPMEELPYQPYMGSVVLDQDEDEEECPF